MLAVLALNKIGLDNIASALLNSSPSYVLLGLAVMCGAMVMRAFSWHAILRAALPDARIRLADAMQGTFIGVLMSSTLPARLGEPSRALVVARRTGRPRENLPVVLGTLVSQTLLNIAALAVLGAVMFSSVDLFSGHQDALLVAAIAPLALLVLVLLAPVVLRHGAPGSRLGRAPRLLAQGRGGDDPGARRAGRVPPARGSASIAAAGPVRGLGAAVAVLLLPARRARPQPPGRHGGGGGRAVRGQHHRRAAGHAGQPGRLPGRLRGRAAHRLARRASAPASPTA